MDTLMTEAAIAVLPYGGKLGRRLSGRDLDDLIWPLGRPARLSSGRVADLTPDDHLIIYPKTNMHFCQTSGPAPRSLRWWLNHPLSTRGICAGCASPTGGFSG